MNRQAPRSQVTLADWGDGVGALAPASIDLFYADPPFNTGVRQSTPAGATRAGRGIDTSYADAWPSMAHYVEWLRERLARTLPVLRPRANVLLHVDQRTCHHARLMLDDLLGEAGFVNHIIWSYGLGGSSSRRFARKHDDILWYTLDPAGYFFAPPRVEATSRRMRGQTKKATDVLDIPSLNNMASERTGYPTQKPLELLTLLLRACAPPGATVLDPCCGSGTTLVAAQSLGMHSIGFDTNPAAVDLARARLAAGEQS